MIPALFLDRDGTIIYDKHNICDPADVCLIPGMRIALVADLNAGYKLFIFSNQSGIGWGYFSWEDFYACNKQMFKLLDLPSAVFTEIKAAPETATQPSLYRKPSPLFIEEMIAKYNLDTSRSWMIGDRKSDWEAGINAGIQSVAVKTGKPIDSESEAFLQQYNVPLYNDVLTFIREGLKLPV
ncbi:MAG: HAD-IIIA family hydrolase [Puniceicoccales bacterium]|jgi:D-glycero-D-manno-heptose 1,7-bisphosphate phosphatase|nr:HAD-IIIA family hydrolase [Puniceicoccales bacterium]